MRSQRWNTVKRTAHGEQYHGELWESFEGKSRGPLSQVYFVPCIVLRPDFTTALTNICIQLIRHVYSCWMSYYSYKSQPGQYILNLYITSCLAFMLCTIGLPVSSWSVTWFSNATKEHFHCQDILSPKYPGLCPALEEFRQRWLLCASLPWCCRLQIFYQT